MPIQIYTVWLGTQDELLGELAIKKTIGPLDPIVDAKIALKLEV